MKALAPKCAVPRNSNKPGLEITRRHDAGSLRGARHGDFTPVIESSSSVSVRNTVPFSVADLMHLLTPFSKSMNVSFAQSCSLISSRVTSWPERLASRARSLKGWSAVSVRCHFYTALQDRGSARKLRSAEDDTCRSMANPTLAPLLMRVIIPSSLSRIDLCSQPPS
jgi:hypothetical protein